MRGLESSRPEYFQIDLLDKVSTVLDDTTGHNFKIFLWSLHNTVNSSIGRKEQWYPDINTVKKDDRMKECGVEYTLRWWPRTVQSFKGLENHRSYLPTLSKDLKDKTCRSIAGDAKVQAIKAEVKSAFDTHGAEIAEQLRRSYGLVAGKPDQLLPKEYDVTMQTPELMDSMRTCKYVISDDLPVVTLLGNLLI